MEERHKKDLEILKQLYFGNHLNEMEKERAYKVLKSLEIELKSRI
jgi:hypothetical protein